MPFRLLIFIVAYNAKDHIESVLDRIPASLWNQQDYPCDVLILDDCSKDDTTLVCEAYKARTGRQFTAIRNEKNRGYGGNQKKGYQYAIDNGYSAVVLLHGDGQYAPELIETLAEPVKNDAADVVIGSRMMNRKSALKGGMPLYKFFGNIVLTKIQNIILGSDLSEFHSGYRVYRVSSLASVPFHANANYFDFDTDILIQMIQTQQRIHEISIPTFYGDEICHVNGMKYAFLILVSSVRAALQKRGIGHIAKFDYRKRA